MKVGFFHVGRGETPHVRLASLLIRSVRSSMPGVPIVHFTDHNTEPMAGVDEVVRRMPKPIALGCLEHYAEAGEGNWLFVDTDVIVQRDVRWIFEKPFDIAVADRQGTLSTKEVGTKFMAAMPYNKGAVFSRCPRFWLAAAARLRELKPARQEWMGDQQAMCDTIASGRFKVEVLDARYNWPPKSKDDMNDKAILHYKGSRKRWMLSGGEA